MNPNFEILAPAGNMEILKAVIDAGADAVYLGGSRFGARAYANNFTEEEMLAALDYSHLRNVRIYLTVNTLFKNAELQELYEYLRPFYERGLDAVLVQDFGALRAIHSLFPDLPIHTSTQMTVTGTDAIPLLREYGVSRVVMAREMSIAEMQELHEKTGMELEAFIHGALCYSYSGQCLFSSLLGGRSGNRGRCAQPCRLPYAVLDSRQKLLKKDSYILSLKDCCGIRELGTLQKAGVYSLKIEGRMKQEAYAASVVAMYRKYVDLLASCDSAEITADDYADLESCGNRCGFTDTFFHKHNSETMVTYEKPSFVSTNTYQKPEAKYIPIRGAATLRANEPAKLKIWHPALVEPIVVLGDIVQCAKNRPLTREEVWARLQKTKDSAFLFEQLSVSMEDGLFMPNGAINQWKRDAIETLEQQLLARSKRTVSESEGCMRTAEFNVLPAQNHVWIEQREQLDAALSFDFAQIVAISANAYRQMAFCKELADDFAKIHRAKKQAYLLMPTIFRNETSAFFAQLLPQLQKIEFEGFIVKTLEEIGFCRRYFPDKTLIADHNLYTYNDAARETLQAWGISSDVIPFELNRSEIQGRDNHGSICQIYGYYPLMTTANCVHRNVCGCDKKPGLCYLQDRYHKHFPVQNCCTFCYNTIYNTLPTVLLKNMPQLTDCGIEQFLVHFTIETAEQAKAVCHMIDENAPYQGEYTNGHFKRGVE